MATPTKKTRKPASRTFGRTAAVAVGTAAVGIASAVVALLLRRGRDAAGEHRAPDLAPGKARPAAGDRAPVDFRPDPTAIPTAAEREGLRPATGHATAFAADRGSTVTERIDAA